MTETMVTLVGNVATGVEFKESPTGGVARFRFAVPARRWDRARADWTDGPTSFYTVWAWRSLAANLAASVSVGEPLVVRGRLRVREEDREGGRRTFVDVEAAAAGHDLSRGTSAFRRVARAARMTPHQGEAVAGLLARTGGGRDAPGDPWSAPADRTGPAAADAVKAPVEVSAGTSLVNALVDRAESGMASQADGAFPAPGGGEERAAKAGAATRDEGAPEDTEPGPVTDPGVRGAAGPRRKASARSS